MQQQQGDSSRQFVNNPDQHIIFQNEEILNQIPDEHINASFGDSPGNIDLIEQSSFTRTPNSNLQEQSLQNFSLTLNEQQIAEKLL